jgi:hypothetical protein
VECAQDSLLAGTVAEAIVGGAGGGHHALELGVFETRELFVGRFQRQRQLGARVLVQRTGVMICVFQQLFRVLDDETQVANQLLLRLGAVRGFHCFTFSRLI